MSLVGHTVGYHEQGYPEYADTFYFGPGSYSYTTYYNGASDATLLRNAHTGPNGKLFVEFNPD